MALFLRHNGGRTRVRPFRLRHAFPGNSPHEDFHEGATGEAPAETCSLCAKNCPLDAPGCGRGAAYAAKIRMDT